MIVLGHIELDRLRAALQQQLGDSVDRPNTPARIEHALALLLARDGLPGRPTVQRRPAGLSSPEYWEIEPPRRRARHRRGRPRRGPVRRFAARDSGPSASSAGARPTPGRGRSAVAAACRTVSRHGSPPSCPVCRPAIGPWTTTAGCPASTAPEPRLDLVRHQAEHDRHPVGDDDWLESMRVGDRIRIGRWSAPFETVRRYLVTGQVQAGRNRALAHDAIVTAMTQINRWGPGGVLFGDLPEWQEARATVVELMERFGRGRN